jgi:hypothetical protein
MDTSSDGVFHVDFHVTSFGLGNGLLNTGVIAADRWGNKAPRDEKKNSQLALTLTLEKMENKVQLWKYTL